MTLLLWTRIFHKDQDAKEFEGLTSGSLFQWSFVKLNICPDHIWQLLWRKHLHKIREAKHLVLHHHFLHEPKHHQLNCGCSTFKQEANRSMVGHLSMPWPIPCHEQWQQSDMQHHSRPHRWLLLHSLEGILLQLRRSHCSRQCSEALDWDHSIQGLWKFHLLQQPKRSFDSRFQSRAGRFNGENCLNWGSFPSIEFQKLPQLIAFVGFCAH